MSPGEERLVIDGLRHFGEVYQAQRDEWKARAKKAEARLSEIEALCDQAEEGYGEGIWGRDVSAAELRAILKETS